ncbi:MAG: DNA polymerase/3'-5' exonuclease PolX, partial [Chitinivibrionales bacterium]|nr:DNA polymerase/3'-5' exonuclease PolX [Chitinivibrionales bacterium]
KRVKKIHDKLGVSTLDDLDKAAKNGRIRNIEGFGAKTEESILEGIKQVRQGQQRRLRVEVEASAADCVAHLKKADKVQHVIIAGSFRRHRETVHDLDILATCSKGSNIMDHFVFFDEVGKVVSKGEIRSTVILRSGLQVDLRIVPQVSYGAALQYFTGSKEHNIGIRKMGVKRNLTINEYGIFRRKKRIGGRTEGEVYDAVGLPWIEPELRENRGEIDAAKKRKLPILVTLEDIRGDLHVHSNYTDGKEPLEKMVDAARARNYEYVAVTDHSRHVRVARGLDVRRLHKQIEEINKLNDSVKDIVILKGIELDILADGSLDLPDEVLKELDFTVCSVHYKFGLPEKEQTRRVIRAMDNRYFTVLGHPTGRMINERPPYEIDIEQVLDAAAGRGCFMEINGQPHRLDLPDHYCRAAKDRGVKCVLSTDAHLGANLDFIRHAVAQARRGWLEPDDIVNTRNGSELKTLLTQRR